MQWKIQLKKKTPLQLEVSYYDYCHYHHYRKAAEKRGT